MRFGVIILPFDRWPAARTAWQTAEELGFDVAWTADHLVHPLIHGQFWSETWTTLAAAAAVTDRLLIGPLVTSAAYRHPATVARHAVTVDDISGGRLELGVGSGSPRCREAIGEPAGSPADRVRRYEEFVGALDLLLRGGSSHRGPHFVAEGDFGDSTTPQRPRPPLTLGGSGPRSLRVVACYGDAWTTYGPTGDPAAGPRATDEALRAQSSLLDAALDEVGRPRDDVRRSVLRGFTDERPLASLEAFRDCVGRSAELGFGEVVVYWPSDAAGGRFAADARVLDAIAAELPSLRAEPTV